MARVYLLKKNPEFRGKKESECLTGKVVLRVTRNEAVIEVKGGEEDREIELTREQLKCLYYLLTENED